MWCDMCLSLTWLHLVWLSVGPYVFLPGVLFPSSWLSNILLWYMYLPVYVYICTLHLLKAIISSLSIGLLPCLHCFKKYCYEHWGAWIKVFPFLDIYPGVGFLHHMVILFLLFQFSIVKVKVTQSCPTLCNPIDYTVHGIHQARILAWVAYPFSRGSSWSRNWTGVSHIGGRFFTSWATREAQ